MVSFTYPWALILALPAAWLLWRSRRRATETHSVANLFLWLDSSTAAPTSQRDRSRVPPWFVWLQAAVIGTFAVAIADPASPRSRATAALVVDVSPSMSARDATTSRAELARAAANTWRTAHTPRARTTSVDTTNLVEAIETALRDTDGLVTVITDLPPPANVAELAVVWNQVGTPVDNVAITTLAPRSDGGAILEITNFGAASRDVAIQISDGATASNDRITIAAEGVRSFAIAPGPDRTITAEIRVDRDAGNALNSDDRKTISIRHTQPVSIVLADQNELLDAAIHALSDAHVSSADDKSASSIWVCTSVCSAPLGAPRLIFSAGGTIPTFDRRDVDGVRSITVSADLRTSPWPLTPAFPLFMADAIDWLARRSAPSLDADRLAAISESNTRSANAPFLSPAVANKPAEATRRLWLAFALLAVVGALVELALRRKSPAMRSVAAAAAIAALAGVTLPIGALARDAVILVDVSASVSGNARAANDRARREAAAAGGADHAEVVRFGGAESNIASGIRAARAALSPGTDRRVLLITDGQQTSGDAAAEARDAGAAGVAIDVAAIDSRAPAYIERFDAPVSARAGAAVLLRIGIKGRARELIRVAVSRDGRPLETRRAALDDAGVGSVEVTDTPASTGVAFYRAALVDENLGATLSESAAAVTITGRGRVLVISERGTFRQALGASPLDVDVVELTPDTAPRTREGLSGFSAIVLDSIAPHRMSTQQLAAIAEAVSVDGAGLLLLGGRQSLDISEFTPSGFSDSLPVDFAVLPNPPSAASSIALLVDISGSMASTSDGVTKISAARDAIRRTLAIVPKADAITVIGFAEQPSTLIGSSEARDAAAVAERLKNLSPSGSTALAPAVSEAVRWLKSTPNRRRRLLLVTDGKTSVSDADSARRAVIGEGIEVSAITIGNDAEREWLSALASATGGRAFFPERLGDLAREVAREAARGATGREIDDPFVVRAGAHPLAPSGALPALGGYIAGRLRDGATAAWKSRSDDAVLAAWPRGLGRVATFSAELGGAWGEPLRRWPQSAAFWRGAIQWLARSSEPSAIDAALTLAVDGPRLVVDLPESARTEGPLPAVRASLAGPSGQPSHFALHAVSPTRFEATAPLAEAGEYRATISVVGPSGAESRSVRGWYWTGDLESQSRGLNTALLEEIARVSGGRVLQPISAPPLPGDSIWSASRARGRMNAVPWLMLAALLLLSFDYIRRTREI